MVLRPSCTCFIILYFCLLSFPRRFCCSKFILFRSPACLFCLYLSFVEESIGSWACLVFFCLFSDFIFFLLHAFSAVGFVLFLHAFPIVFIISFGLTFLSFMQFLLLTLSAVPCFFLLCFFLLVFTLTLLYKRIWAFVGQIMFTRSKGSWTQFALIY